jgi:hypothetical protein
MAPHVNDRRHRTAVVALLACAILAGCDWPWRHDMADQPSAPASAGPRSPAAGSIPMEARGPFDRVSGEFVSNPLPPAPHDPTDRALFEKYCLPCHGGPVERFFVRVPPLQSADVQRHGDGWFYATITNGTPIMPAYRYELDPTERWRIVRFLRRPVQ